MGGDNAPRSVVEGAAIALERYPQARFLFFGDQKKIARFLEKRPKLKDVSEIHHTDVVVKNDDKPAVALRSGRQSSMRLAIDAVARGEADCVVSGGNTGALMAMAKFSLKTLPGITRPAIASQHPTLRDGHKTVFLDLGANVICDARMLVEFAILGAVYSHEVLKVEHPKISLMNVGEEEMKGNEQVREAARMLSAQTTLPGEFAGFAEGNDIASGRVDVIVMDGFTGNVALKTSEGTAKLVSHMMREAISSSIFSKLGYLLMSRAVRNLRERVDPRQYNGGIFMGLRGLCVKSHGGSDGTAFANAIRVAADMAVNKFNKSVEREIEEMGLDKKQAPEKPATTDQKAGAEG